MRTQNSIKNSITQFITNIITILFLFVVQTQVYMNYIDKQIKTISQNKTIGIIICKKENKFVLEYCSDPRIYEITYMLIKEYI